MEAISLKLDEHMLKHLDASLQQHNYSTRTEFIRDAIRDKLDSLKRKEALETFLALRGKASKKTTRAENRKTAQEALKELVQEKGWEL